MISLKLSPEANDDSMLGSSGQTSYGYGTCISLEEEQVTALGIDKLTVGTKVKITAYGIISRTSVDVGEEGEAPGPDMSIQLTDLEASKASSVDASAMYPSSNG